jgi:hypothetical protein
MSIVTVQDESVTWGDLQLHGPLPVDATYEIKTMSDGTNFGNPVSIIEQVQSMAIDGALAARTGWDARSIPVRLRIGANDGETLSQVEQALTAQMLLDRPPRPRLSHRQQRGGALSVRQRRSPRRLLRSYPRRGARRRDHGADLTGTFKALPRRARGRSGRRSP